MVSGPLEGALERVLVLPGIFIDLDDFGFRDLEGENAAYALAARMHVQHHLGGAIVIHSEEQLQDLDHELHGGEVVIQQHDAVHRRKLDLGARLLDDYAAILLRFQFIAHGCILVHGPGASKPLRSDCRIRRQATVRL